ncbi:MAG: hypothetical protein ISQ83_07195 [Alphaproteobacteria bacterium]|nr:hypothetical protein [Alphaproteobacteria bacterium]
MKFSEITHPKNSNMFAEFDDYINIKKEDLTDLFTNICISRETSFK